MVIEKKICDRCKAEISDIPNCINPSGFPTYILRQIKYGCIKEIDLCRRCQEKLDALIIKWLIDGEMKNESD